ncbi:uncharacterized protein EV422DRAFT_264047 [Fimicolochytrium jonesii]|uniref:uncharacterized protein n=1 Tax=Fimicolochytrium jonesii TaxID=1396493 RepID=UPI0022FE923E|nr:uncharacterized protein EV422DRAFT_264047 [Fimicolochytrium jonesii]KAI8817076.1 hypothetical protein EV422DRAFT_264047 [Fimicolochytrium jonesii]
MPFEAGPASLPSPDASPSTEPLELPAALKGDERSAGMFMGENGPDNMAEVDEDAQQNQSLHLSHIFVTWIFGVFLVTAFFAVPVSLLFFPLAAVAAVPIVTSATVCFYSTKIVYMGLRRVARRLGFGRKKTKSDAAAKKDDTLGEYKMQYYLSDDAAETGDDEVLMSDVDAMSDSSAGAGVHTTQRYPHPQQQLQTHSSNGSLNAAVNNAFYTHSNFSKPDLGLQQRKPLPQLSRHGSLRYSLSPNAQGEEMPQEPGSRLSWHGGSSTAPTLERRYSHSERKNSLSSLVSPIHSSPSHQQYPSSYQHPTHAHAHSYPQHQHQHAQPHPQHHPPHSQQQQHAALPPPMPPTPEPKIAVRHLRQGDEHFIRICRDLLRSAAHSSKKEKADSHIPSDDTDGTEDEDDDDGIVFPRVGPDEENDHHILSYWRAETGRNRDSANLGTRDLVGFIEYFHPLTDPTHICIDKLYVNNLYEGRGFSRRLIQELHRLPRIQTVQVWSLWHTEGFYKEHGYVDVPDASHVGDQDADGEGQVVPRVKADWGPLLVWVRPPVPRGDVGDGGGGNARATREEKKGWRMSVVGDGAYRF